MKTIWLISLLIAVVVYVVGAYVTFDRSSDEQQIISAIENSAKAVEEKDLGKLFKPVSREYKDSSGMNYEKARVLIAQGLSGDTNYNASVSIGNIEFASDMATVNVKAHITELRTGRTIYNRQITLNFRQEPARHALFIPIKKWRVVSSSDIGLQDYY
ncbi:MAG: hypothetical protein SNJ70_09780 [Armatimonadota bacterium]